MGQSSCPSCTLIFPISPEATTQPGNVTTTFKVQNPGHEFVLYGSSIEGTCSYKIEGDRMWTTLNSTSSGSSTTICPSILTSSTQLPTGHTITILCMGVTLVESLSFCTQSSQTQKPSTPTLTPTPTTTPTTTTIPIITFLPSLSNPISSNTLTVLAPDQDVPSATSTQPSSTAIRPSVIQTPPTDLSSPKNAHKAEVAGGVVGGIVIILTMFLIWRRCHKSRRILIHDKEKAAARHSIRQPSIWSLVSPTSTMLAEAASFDPTRMVKTGSPFDKRAFLENNPAGEVHPLPNNLL